MIDGLEISSELLFQGFMDTEKDGPTVSPVLFTVLFIVVAVVLVITFIFWYRNRLFESSRRTIKRVLEREIERADRYYYAMGLLILELSESIPRGVHRFLPGTTIDVEHLERHLRRYDVVVKTDVRRYTALLPQTAAADGTVAVRRRLEKVAQEQGWGEVRIGVATYPQDGRTADELLQAALDSGRFK